ncbi:MAG TPA: AAA family ATPase [Gammaproteobacteria bacterium]|nr:AAA family ATPase [Gammaproteobacteria bacterium]
MYETHFGLREKPFSLLPDPSFLYLSDKHRTALALLQYGLSNQAGFTAITGGIGTGKTTLIRYLLNTMAQDVTVGLISNTHRSFGELLQWILLAFNLDYANKSKVEMYQTFVDFMVREYARKRRTVLIVDEAQNMSADTLEELRMLSNINADKDQVLQVVLVGQQQLRDTLRRPDLVQFAQRIAVDYHLTAMTAEDTQAYIRHRLSVAGGEAELFTDEACAAVHRYSHGVPRLVNLLSDLAMVYGYAERRDQIDADLIADVARDKQAGGLFPAPETGYVPNHAPHSQPNHGSKKKLRLAIAGESHILRGHLRRLLEDQGMQVVDEMPLDEITISRIDPDAIDILLVDLDDNAEDRIGNLYDMLAQWNLPVLFNDSQVTEASLHGQDPQFGPKLTSKLMSLLPASAVDNGNAA